MCKIQKYLTGISGVVAALVLFLVPPDAPAALVSLPQFQSYDVGLGSTWGINSAGQPIPGIESAWEGTTPVGSNGFDVVCGGIDIWNVADGFRFVYTALTGDFDIRTRVASLTKANTFTKGGLMARDGLTSTAKFFDVFAEPADGDNLCSSECRSTVQGNAFSVGGTSYPYAGTSYPNMWLRLQRTGNVFQGFRSADGTNWTLLGVANISMSTTLAVGLATTAHDYDGAGLVTTAQYRDISIRGPVVPPPTLISSFSSGSFRLTVVGSAATDYILEGSVDLKTWTGIQGVRTTSSGVATIPISTSGLPQRFFRVYEGD